MNYSNSVGLTLIIATGIVWGGIGVVLAVVSKEKIETWSFIGIATGISSLGAWFFLVDWPLLLSGEANAPLQLFYILGFGGVTSIIGMACLQKSMKAGAAAWAIGQSALVFPFLAGVVFLDDVLYTSGVFGVITILFSLILFTKANRHKKEYQQSWLRYALMAFVFLGIPQTMSTIPSSWEGWSDNAGLRVPIVLTAGAIPLLCLVIYKKKSVQRGAIKLSFYYAILVITGQGLLFSAMDHLKNEKKLSLAFPLALGTCIIVVALWEIYIKRKWPDLFTLSGIMSGIIGISLLTI